MALRRVVVLGTPLTLAVLEFFQPQVSRDLAGSLFPVASWWVTLHVVQLVLFALMGAALWLLTDGLHGIATTVSRLGAATFVVFYGAGDTLLGIATGILALGAGDIPIAVREGRVEAIATIFESPVAIGVYFVGELRWLVGLLAAVVALYAGALPAHLSSCLCSQASFCWSLTTLRHTARSSSVRSLLVPSGLNSRGVGDLYPGALSTRKLNLR